jgi:hypothetical protein
MDFPQCESMPDKFRGFSHVIMSNILSVLKLAAINLKNCVRQYCKAKAVLITPASGHSFY